MDTLLVVGGSGLLGGKVCAAARPTHDVVGTCRGTAPTIEGVRFVEWHKERIEEGAALVRTLRPAAIVDTAALHNVDRCEVERDLAWTVNAGSTGALARAAQDVGARYLFVSTDFVFDGTKGGYREEDVPRPVNYYGETKLAGEHAVLAAGGDHVVVRPSVVFGWDDTRLNFATWVLASLKEGKPVNVATDWIGSPTFADALASGILKLLALPDGGLYHLAGTDALSRHDFAARLAKAFSLDAGLVKPVRSAELNLKARRPPDSSLSSGKARRHRVSVGSANEGIAAMKGQRSLDRFVPPARFKS